jgi:hypothetical protein
MPAYFVSIPASVSSKTLRGGVDSVVVFAADEANAKAIAKAAMGSDANTLWDNATVTTIAAAANWIGYRFRFIQTTPAGVVVKDIPLTATGAGQDTLDEIGAALATAIGGGAAYNGTTQVLTVAASGSGDHSLSLEAYLPEAQSEELVPIPGVIGAYVHRGSAGSALSVALAADAHVIPTLIARTITA